MSAMVTQITSVSIVCSTVFFIRRSKKNQSSASLAFVRGIHRSPVGSPHKGPVTRHHEMDSFINSWSTALPSHWWSGQVLSTWNKKNSPQNYQDAVHLNTSIPKQNCRRHFPMYLLFKNIEFLFKFHWNLFWRVRLTISHNWSRWLLGTEQATSH